MPTNEDWSSERPWHQGPDLDRIAAEQARQGEIEATADEMLRFYGDDASIVAARNIHMRGRAPDWKEFWLAVWRCIQRKDH